MTKASWKLIVFSGSLLMSSLSIAAGTGGIGSGNISSKLQASCAPYETSYDVQSKSYVDIKREFCLISDESGTHQAIILDIVPNQSPLTHIANLQFNVYPYLISSLTASKSLTNDDLISLKAEATNDKTSRIEAILNASLKEKGHVSNPTQVYLNTFWGNEHLGYHTLSNFRQLRTFSDANYTVNMKSKADLKVCTKLLQQVIDSGRFGGAVILSGQDTKSVQIAASEALAQWLGDEVGPLARECTASVKSIQ